MWSWWYRGSSLIPVLPYPQQTGVGVPDYIEVQRRVKVTIDQKYVLQGASPYGFTWQGFAVFGVDEREAAEELAGQQTEPCRVMVCINVWESDPAYTERWEAQQ